MRFLSLGPCIGLSLYLCPCWVHAHANARCGLQCHGQAQAHARDQPGHCYFATRLQQECHHPTSLVQWRSHLTCRLPEDIVILPLCCARVITLPPISSENITTPPLCTAKNVILPASFTEDNIISPLSAAQDIVPSPCSAKSVALPSRFAENVIIMLIFSAEDVASSPNHSKNISPPLGSHSPALCLLLCLRWCLSHNPGTLVNFLHRGAEPP